MNQIVDQRKDKFEKYLALRQAGSQALEEAQDKEKEAETEQAQYTVFDRIHDLADQDSFEEFDYCFKPSDPLDFPGYLEKKKGLTEKTGCQEAVISGTCTIKGYPLVLAVMNKAFLMGSMGMEVGERISLAAEYALQKKLPLVIFTASGGARMQEGIMALMQMAKTAAVIERFKNQGGLYIAVLTHPTTGGVSASFASLGDICLAEPGALIGFAGPRVIEQTIGQKLPLGFQRAEFLKEHGFVDQVVAREDMRAVLGQLLRLHGGVYEGNR